MLLEEVKKIHYCVLLITKQLPTEEEIERIMSPYDECNYEYNDEGNMMYVYPIFQFDYYKIGGRYNGSLKLKIDSDDDYYNWNFYSKEPRNGKLYWSYLFDFIKTNTTYPFFREEDFYRSMGIRDGFLYIDGARIKDLLNFNDIQCYICIDDVNGDVIARESYNGNKWVEDKDFDKKLSEIKQKSNDCFATILDIHD